MLHPKNTILTKPTRSTGGISAMLIIVAGTQSFQFETCNTQRYKRRHKMSHAGWQRYQLNTLE